MQNTTKEIKKICPEKFNKIKSDLIDNLENQARLGHKESILDIIGRNNLDNFLDPITTAELIFQEISLDSFKFDYSCVIILYCKAIEIIEKRKCEEIAENLDKLINCDTSNMKKGYLTKIMTFPEKDIWVERMVKETYYRDKEGKDLNIFYSQKARHKLADFKRYDISGDNYMYNTLLFYYYITKGTIDIDKYSLIRDIYYLFHFDRNGSAHTDQKSRSDADKVRKKIMGKTTSDSLIYKVIENFWLKDNS